MIRTANILCLTIQCQPAHYLTYHSRYSSMERRMTRENYSKDSEYHTQRNNAVVPYSSCNTTSLVMALKQARWPIPERGMQPEDDLSKFLQTPEAHAKLKDLAPWFVGTFPPQEVHATLEWGTNEWMKGTADRFTLGATSKDLVMALSTGGGAVLSGRFPREGAPDMGHIVSLAGFVRKNGEITHWVIDDPYGDWHSNYQNHHGNDIAYTHDEFDTIFRRDTGFYWAHLIRRCK